MWQYLLIALAIIMMLMVGLMGFFAYLANKYNVRQVQRRHQDISETSPYRKSREVQRPNNEILSKDRGLEKIKEEQEATKYNDESRELETRQASQDMIVGVAKPVGMWSNFIMKQKLGFIIAMGGLQGNKKGGFWVNLIKAQAASRGKDQGKAR